MEGFSGVGFVSKTGATGAPPLSGGSLTYALSLVNPLKTLVDCKHFPILSQHVTEKNKFYNH
jgi:hypothetical protein